MTSVYSLEELERRCSRVRSELLDFAAGYLNFGQVMSILSVYGYKPDETASPYTPNASEQEKVLALQGRRRRRWNAVLCGEKIAPLWSLDLLKDYLEPEEVNKLRHLDLNAHLRRAKQAILHDQDFPVVEFEPSPDELNYSLNTIRKQSIAVNRAVATHRVIWSILFIVSADEFNIFDAELQYPDGWFGDNMETPSALRASHAFDGRPVRNPTHPLDPRRSREFWLWWLDEAVPAAWHLRDL